MPKTAKLVIIKNMEKHTHDSFDSFFDYLNNAITDFENLDTKKFLDSFSIEQLESTPDLVDILQDYYSLLCRLGKPDAFLDQKFSLTKHYGGKILALFYPLSVKNIVSHDIIDHTIGESAGMLTPFADDYPSWRVESRVPRFLQEKLLQLKLAGKNIPRHFGATIDRFGDDVNNPLDHIKSQQYNENIKHSLLLRSMSIAMGIRQFCSIICRENFTLSDLEQETIDTRANLFDIINNDNCIDSLSKLDNRNLVLLLEKSIRVLENFVDGLVEKLYKNKLEVLELLQPSQNNS